MTVRNKILFFLIIVSLALPASAVFAENQSRLSVSKIHYQQKQISELSEIPLIGVKSNSQQNDIDVKVDELINLLEAHKKAVEQGQNIDLLQKKVIEINELLEEKKSKPAKLTLKEFHSSICFRCHQVNDFSPADRTPKQWQRLIEADGHSIFATIPWETPLQKKQIVEFLNKNAGACCAEGIGVWD